MNKSPTPSPNRIRSTSGNSEFTLLRRLIVPLGVDLAAIVAFIAIGRRNHDEDVSFTGFVTTVAPFVLALVVSWLIGRVWRNPTTLRSGVIVWIGTVSVGMVLRRFVFDDGTATAFVIVATIFVGVLVNGWRAVVRVRASS